MKNLLTKSTELTSIIRAEIAAAGGGISFARFMELALYHPTLGYYTSGTVAFGEHGDFITAPEISPLFAQCLAAACVPWLSGENAILELGAGSGRLAKDLLLALEKCNKLPVTYFIYEISPSLRERQRAFLQKECGHLLSRIQWLEALPVQFSGVVIANEVVDALPCHCFHIEKDDVKERQVTWENNQFAWVLQAASPVLAAKITELQQRYSLAPGYESEILLSLTDFMQSLAHSVENGVLFFIDYGYGQGEYYHPSRQHGTLNCYHQQRRYDNPLVHVGLQDVTAYVDFTALAEAGVAAGLSLVGYTTQAGFLLSCGLMEFAMQAEESLGSVEQIQQRQAIKLLTLPSEMGERVKVMAFSRGAEGEVMGFGLQDRRGELCRLG